MDTFMDKLAQKMTAQEMIKANSAADAEEMERLKSRIEEYRRILDRMEKLVEDGTAKLESAHADGEEINRLVEESIAKIKAMQQNTEGFDHLARLSGELKAGLEGLRTAAEEQQASTMGKLASVEENVHKECVKVYRNVQAAVAEENNKQSQSFETTAKGVKGKLAAVLGVSVAALAISLGSLVFQLLVYLQVI